MALLHISMQSVNTLVRSWLGGSWALKVPCMISAAFLRYQIIHHLFFSKISDDMSTFYFIY